MPVLRVSDGGNNDKYMRVKGSGTTTDPYSYDYAPPYEAPVVSTFAASGTIVAGVAGSVIAMEYHTQQNLGTADCTLELRDGATPFNKNLLPYTPGQNFASFCAPAPGREWRLTAGSALVINMTGSGSVLTNTRYWFEPA